MAARTALTAVLLFLAVNISAAGTIINTNGSDGGVAISGFDVVSYHTQKEPVKGREDIFLQWNDARWLFSTEANRDLFRADPEKYAPQYGGHCALGVSEGYISKKPTAGQFEIVRGKLYLFPDGSRTPAGAKNDWWQRGGPSQRVHWADKNWLTLREGLKSQ